MHSQQLEFSNEIKLEMKTVQTFLLFILLIAVGPYPQDVSATGIELESPESRTDTIKLEGLTTVDPNEEIQHEILFSLEKVTATSLELQNTVIILQLPIENIIPVNSSPNDAPNTTLNSETTSEKIDGAVTTSESESIALIPESISNSEIAADLALPTTVKSVESVSTTKSIAGDPELKPIAEINSTTKLTPKVVESKNTTGFPKTSWTSESSSKLPVPTVPSSFQSLSSSTESQGTSSIQQSRTGLGTTSSFHELVSETQDATETRFDTSSNSSESNSASESASESLLLTIANSAESIPASTAAKTETTLSPTQLSEGSAAVESLCHSNCVPSLDPLEGAQSATTQQNDDKLPETSSTSTSQYIESDIEDVGNSSITKESVATDEIEAHSTPAVLESATQTGPVSKVDADASAVSSSITETDGPAEATGTETPDVVRASNADTPNAVENIETSTGPSQTPSAHSSPSTDPSTSESIPASTEATQSPPYTDNTSSTPSESRSTSESAPELPSAIPEITSDGPPPLPCTEAGNFPNPASCLTYISCSGNITDLLRQEIVCPDRSAFSPVFRRCTRDISPCNDGPSCVYPGSIADPTNPSSYYWCVPSLLGGFHKYHIQCSVDEAFNALFGRCLLKTPTYGLISPSFGIPNDRDIAKAESKQMKKELKAKAKEEKIRLKTAAKAKADAEKLALKQQKKQKAAIESDD